MQGLAAVYGFAPAAVELHFHVIQRRGDGKRRRHGRARGGFTGGNQRVQGGSLEQPGLDADAEGAPRTLPVRQIFG